MPKKRGFWTENDHFHRFFGHFWTGLGWPAGHLLGNRPFLPKKRHFWSRDEHYPRFFGHFLTSGRAWPSLAQTKLVRTSIWSPGEAYRSSNRRVFQAKLPPRPPKLPQDPPQTPPGGVWKILYYFKIFGLSAQVWSNLLAVPPGRFAAGWDGELC